MSNTNWVMILAVGLGLAFFLNLQDSIGNIIMSKQAQMYAGIFLIGITVLWYLANIIPNLHYSSEDEHRFKKKEDERFFGKSNPTEESMPSSNSPEVNIDIKLQDPRPIIETTKKEDVDTTIIDVSHQRIDPSKPSTYIKPS